MSIEWINENTKWQIVDPHGDVDMIALIAIDILRILLPKKSQREYWELNVLIENGDRSEAPICAPKDLNPKQIHDYHIHLKYSRWCWAQLVFQLAHELNHMFMRCHPREKHFKWISETLCEVASLLALHNLSPYCREATNCPGQDIYMDYLSNYLRKFNPLKYGISKPSAFLKVYEKTLDDSIQLERYRNSHLATYLFEAMNRSPDNWDALLMIYKVEMDSLGLARPEDNHIHSNELCKQFFHQWSRAFESQSPQARFVDLIFHQLFD